MPTASEFRLVLRSLEPGDETDALTAHAELAHEGFEFLLDYHDGMDWSEFLRYHSALARGANLPDDRVQGAFLVAEVDGELVGRCSIRHQLNDFLREVGGHIGYAVRPEFRRRGYAKAILGEALTYCRALGLDRVLVTCDEENVGSWRTIEFHGGELESTIEHQGVRKRRYWIALLP